MAFIALLDGPPSPIGSQVYLQQYSLDAEDNLLARKYVTQVRILKYASDMLIIIVAIGLAAQALLSNVTAGVQIAISQQSG